MTTEIVRIDPSDFGKDELTAAASLIKRGGLVVFPTETVYGLGADATDPVAAMRIYEAKGRPSDNPLIIHIADPADAERYTYTSPAYYELARLFMPGPLTVIMRSRDTVPKQTRGGLDTVAVRCPSHPIARELIRLSGVAIAAPSANLSGSPSPTQPSHVIDDMLGRCDMIIDGGSCDFGLESTIVKINDDSTLTLLRPGKITVEDLEKCGFAVEVAAAVADKLADGEVALSPGMKYRHYAPASPVILLDASDESSIKYILSNGEANIAVIAYTESVAAYKVALPGAEIYDFGSREDRFEQAHKLFSILREADKMSFDVIYAPLPSKDGVGLALYNRMIRAAAHKIIKL